MTPQKNTCHSSDVVPIISASETNFNIRDIRHQLTRSSLFHHRKRVGKAHMMFSEFQLCATSIKRCLYRYMRPVIKEGFAVFINEVHHKFRLTPLPEDWFQFYIKLYEVFRTRHMFADELPPGCQEKEERSTPCYDFILQPIFVAFQLRLNSILMYRWHRLSTGPAEQSLNFVLLHHL